MEIEINLTYIILAIVLCIFIFLFHNGFSINLFSKHDTGIIDKFLSKYPDVKPEFITKSAREQIIENNQEIHELNKEMAELKASMQKVIDILEELQK